MSKGSLVVEFWEFLRIRKRYWLLPVIMMLLLMGVVVVFAEGSAFAPFIYSIF